MDKHNVNVIFARKWLRSSMVFFPLLIFWVMSAESAFDAKFAAFANCCRHESLHTYTRSSISNGVIHNGRWMNVELLLNRLYIPVFRMNGNRQVCCVFACIIAFIVRSLNALWIVIACRIPCFYLKTINSQLIYQIAMIFSVCVYG